MADFETFELVNLMNTLKNDFERDGHIYEGRQKLPARNRKKLFEGLTALAKAGVLEYEITDKANNKLIDIDNTPRKIEMYYRITSYDHPKMLQFYNDQNIHEDVGMIMSYNDNIEVPTSYVSEKLHRLSDPDFLINAELSYNDVGSEFMVIFNGKKHYLWVADGDTRSVIEVAVKSMNKPVSRKVLKGVVRKSLPALDSTLFRSKNLLKGVLSPFCEITKDSIVIRNKVKITNTQAENIINKAIRIEE